MVTANKLQAIEDGRTIFQKTVKPLNDTISVLKPGSNNKKLGFAITTKNWRGSKLYSLTLEERKTCPRSCHHWKDCYGNGMRLAHRFNHVGIEKKLEKEIPVLLNKHKEGITIRLHVLGDFFSVKYVRFWNRMLKKHDNLTIFGYTGRYGCSIAKELTKLNDKYSDRCVIRFSQSEEYDGTNSFAAKEDFKGKGFVCPEQTGKVNSCADCGLCWTTKKTVIFKTH